MAEAAAPVAAQERGRLARGNDVDKAMHAMFKSWDAFTRFLKHGRVCLTINGAERAPRGGQRAAVIYNLIVTAKMNDVDPPVWLAGRLCPNC